MEVPYSAMYRAHSRKSEVVPSSTGENVEEKKTPEAIWSGKQVAVPPLRDILMSEPKTKLRVCTTSCDNVHTSQRPSPTSKSRINLNAKTNMTMV